MAAPQPPEGAVSKGQVHSVFKARLNDLVSQGTVFAEAFKRAQGVQRVWNVPSNLTASNLFDIPSLHKESFEREPINTNYLQCFQDPEAMGTIGDVISLKFQMDYNACEERAFRYRHASVCRNLSHALSRRRAHGDGPTFPYIERQAGDAIRAGAQGEPLPATGGPAGGFGLGEGEVLV